MWSIRFPSFTLSLLPNSRLSLLISTTALPRPLRHFPSLSPVDACAFEIIRKKCIETEQKHSQYFRKEGTLRISSSAGTKNSQHYESSLELGFRVGKLPRATANHTGGRSHVLRSRLVASQTIWIVSLRSAVHVNTMASRLQKTDRQMTDRGWTAVDVCGIWTLLAAQCRK